MADFATTVVMTEKDGTGKQVVHLPYSFLPKKKEIKEMNLAVIAYARDLGKIAVSYTYPWEGNTKYPVNSTISLT